MASQNRVLKLRSEMEKFIVNMFGMDLEWVFVSDESSLWNFIEARKDLKTVKDMVKKAKKQYKIDISPVKDKPLIDIIEYVKQQNPAAFT